MGKGKRKMRLPFCLILLVAALPATAAIPPGQWLDLPNDFPKKVRAFMERRAYCIHLAGEARTKFVADSKVKEHCRSIGADEMALKKTYAHNQSVLKFLDISRDWDLLNAPPPQYMRTPAPARRKEL
jgi:hypothetical protein